MKGKKIQPYIFMLPFLLITFIFYVLPAVLTVAMSFTGLDGRFTWDFVGLDNFVRIIKDPNTPKILLNTVIYTGITISITIILDLFLSITTTYIIKNEKVGNMFKMIWMIPMITPVVVYTVMWTWLFEASDVGIVNQLYTYLTGNPSLNWLAEHPFEIIIFATILTSVAFGTINFSSAIKSIPQDQFMAAKVDGASEFEIIKSIILPNLKWSISFITIWELLGLLTNYTTILLLTNGGPGINTEVWSLSAYHKAFVDMNYGYGSAISVMLILVILVLLLILMKMMKFETKSKVE